MKLKDKIKTYSFWVSLASAIILILKLLGNRFNFVVDESMISDLFTALCSILVLLGIIVVPTSSIAANQNENKFQIEKDSAKNKIRKNSISEVVSNINNNECHDNLKNEEIKTEDIKDKTIDLNTPTQNKSSIEQDKNLNSNNDSSEINNDFDETNNVIEVEPKTLQVDEIDNIQHQNTTDIVSIESNKEEPTTTNQTDNFDFKTILNMQREKFSNNLDEYIFELQEAIRKTREGV